MSARLVPAILVVTAFASVLAAATHARASVVIEHYNEGRPAEADPIMKVLRGHFSENGGVADPHIVGDSFRHAPMLAVVDPGLTSAALTDELELSVKKYLHVDYETALQQLPLALQHAHANPGVVVNDEKVRSAMLRAQVALALTHAKLGDRPKAIEAMTAYIRSTPEPVVRKMFGPPGEQLYNEVRKSLDPVKRGTLIVNVSEPDAQIFVNGLGTGRGATFTARLLPGTYCVVVQVRQVARRYDVVIYPDKARTLEIDWSLDSAIHISRQWAGLLITNGRSASEYIGAVSRRMDNLIEIIVVGIRRERDYLAVVGYDYYPATKGQLSHSGEVHVTGAQTPSDKAKLLDLARFLLKGEPSVNIVPIGTPDGSPDGDQSRRWIAYPAAAVALGGIALGGYLLYVDGKPTCESDLATECTSLHSTRTPGIIALTGGLLAGAFAVVWYRSHSSTTPRSTITFHPIGGGGVVTFGGTF